MFGGSDLDLRQASLEGGEATISIVDLFGGTDLYVPDAIEVDFNGIGLFGGADEHGGDLSTHPRGACGRARRAASLDVAHEAERRLSRLGNAR
jgi:hypothetical protein